MTADAQGRAPVLPKLLLGCAVVAAFFLEETLQGPAANHPWRIAGVLAVVAVVVGGLALVLSGGRGLSLVLIVLGGAGWGLVVGWDDRDNLLGPYCAYGARSEAQRDSCLAEVSTEDVDALDTPAARFARGEITGCGSDAGPLCAEAAGTP